MPFWHMPDTSAQGRAFAPKRAVSAAFLRPATHSSLSMVIVSETHFPHVRLMTFLLPTSGLHPQMTRETDFEDPDAATSLHY